MTSAATESVAGFFLKGQEIITAGGAFIIAIAG